MRKGAHDAIEKARPRERELKPSEAGKNGGVNSGVSGGVKALLEFIQRTPGLRTPQISKALDLPVTTLVHWLTQLKSQDKIEFRGSPKTGGYHRKYGKVGGVNAE